MSGKTITVIEQVDFELNGIINGYEDAGYEVVFMCYIPTKDWMAITFRKPFDPEATGEIVPELNDRIAAIEARLHTTYQPVE